MTKRAFYLAVALLWALACLRLYLLPGPAAPLVGLWQRQVEVTGSVEPASVKSTAAGTSLILRCESLALGGEGRPYRHRLRLYVPKKANPQGLALELGRLRCQGRLLPLTSFRNPGGWDGERYNLVQDLGGRLVVEGLEQLSREGGLLDRLALVNAGLRRQVEAALPGEAGALVSGMVLGGSSGLSDPTREVMQNNGLAHLLSVSGTHLLLLASLLRLLLARLSDRFRQPLIALVLLGYACLTGLRPPVLRALAMSWALLLVTGGGIAGAKVKLERGRVLLLTAALLLTWKPAWLYDLGFQLSFAAAAGLLFLLPALQQRIGRCCWGLGEAAAVTLAAQLGLLPLEAGYFHRLLPLAFLSNLLLVPLIELALLLSLLGLGLRALPLGEGVAAWPLAAGSFILEQALRQGQLLASLPGAVLTVPSLPLYCVPAYYGLLGLALDLGPSLRLPSRLRRWAMGALSLLLAASLAWRLLGPRPLTAYFLDVGQGDCTVLVSPQRKVAVIDTGGLQGLDTGSRVVAPFLRSLGFSRVDYLLLSHGDWDHVGGSGGLGRNLAIGRIILPLEGGSSSAAQAGRRPAYRELLQAARGAQVEVAQAGRRYDLGGGSLVVLAVPQAGEEGNEASTLCGLLDEAGRPCLLLPGDLGRAREEELAGLEPYPVLKAGHHGSKGSSSPGFLGQVRPLLTVISCGPFNRYGHPHQETLDRLAAVGSRILRTDEGGCITVSFDEQGLRCYSYK